jgi:hypothetical protein
VRVDPAEALPREPMPPEERRRIAAMPEVARIGVTDRKDCGCITGYVVVTTSGVVAWFRWRPRRREWETVETASVEEVSAP